MKNFDPSEKTTRIRRKAKLADLKLKIENYRLHYAVDDQLIEILRLMTELIEESKKK